MQAEALRWIVNLLQNNEVPFLLCGGFAAIGYGSKRALNDIDLFVPGDRFDEIVLLGEQHISKPAQHYCEEAEGWDLVYVQFLFKGVKIEVGNAHGVKIYDSTASKWVELKLDFSRSQVTSLLGIEVPLMNRIDLMRYKSKLGRPVDLQDIDALS